MDDRFPKPASLWCARRSPHPHESYRLKQSKARRRREAQLADLAAAAADPETGEITSASLKAASALAAKPRPSPPAQTQRVELYNSVN